MLTAVLIGSTLLTVYLIVKICKVPPQFHWLEYTCVTFFFLGINTWSFDFYLAAYPSLEHTGRYLEFAIVIIHFIFMYPLLFMPVISLYKRKKPPVLRYGWTLIWLVGYELLLFMDVGLGIFRIEGPYWVPISVTCFYNIFTICTSIFFMKKMEQMIRKEAKSREKAPGNAS
jgi:hypothetical protein